MAVGVIGAGSAAAELPKVAHSTWVGYGRLYFAKEEGFSTRKGAEVELIVMEDSSSGSGRCSPPARSMCRRQHRRYRAELPGAISRATGYLVRDRRSQGRGRHRRADKDIESVADLKGKSVAYAGGLGLPVLSRRPAQGGRAVDQGRRDHEHDRGDAEAAFVAERVDAAVTWEPWLTRGKQRRRSSAGGSARPARG